MVGWQHVDRRTVRDRDQLPIVRPVPRLVRPDVCGVRVVSALTASSDPWYLGDMAWELENPVPCARGVWVKGSLGGVEGER